MEIQMKRKRYMKKRRKNSHNKAYIFTNTHAPSDATAAPAVVNASIHDVKSEESRSLFVLNSHFFVGGSRCYQDPTVLTRTSKFDFFQQLNN